MKTKVSTKDIFAISYLSSVFGECGSIGLDDMCVAFTHESVKANPDGTIPYACYYQDGTIGVHMDLPQDLYYQLWGYAAIHELAAEEFY